MTIPQFQNENVSFLNDVIIRRSFYSSLLCFSIFFLLLLWKWPSLPSQIPLYYSLPRGTEQLGWSWEIILLPIFSFFLFIIHTLLAAKIHKSNLFFSKILMISQAIVVGLFLITFIKIVFLLS